MILRKVTPLALLAALAVVVVPATASARAQIGISITTGASTSSSSLDSQLDLVRRTGAKLVRVGVSWSSLEPSAPRSYDAATLAAADQAVRDARARGLRVVLNVSSTPCWASSSPAAGDCSSGANSFEVTRYRPSDPRSFVGVSTFLAKRYGRALAAFEVWNEPDQSNERYWAGSDKVRTYVALARAVYRPLKRANPQMQVIAGAFVGQNGRWLRAMYAAGIRGSYDGLSVHFYDQTLLAVRQARRVQIAHHDRKPIWIAEAGWTSCLAHASTYIGHRCVSRAIQARFTADLVASLRRVSGPVAALLLYTAQDQPGEDFGLMDAEGRLKPAFAAMRKATVSRHPAASPLRLTLRVARGRIIATGSGPVADALEIRAYHAGVLRYRARFSLDANGRYSVPIPAAIGVHGTRVVVRQSWLGVSATKRVS